MEKIQNLVRRHGLGHREDHFLHLARPSIRLDLQPLTASPYPSGLSHVGGIPDLPPAVDWPAWQTIPLSFVAQFNLADIAGLDSENVLPHTGLLSFFVLDVQYDPDIDYSDNRPVWQYCVVTYYDGPLAAVQPRAFPETLDLWNRFAPCAVAFRSEYTLPPPDSALIHALALTDAEHTAYWNDIWAGLYADEPHHRLLGYPDPVQDYGMPYHNERLLFQIDSDAQWPSQNGGNWGDAGTLYFMIDTLALALCRFDKVRVEYQGH